MTRLVQFVEEGGDRKVGLASDDGRTLAVLREVSTTYQLARRSAETGRPLAELAEEYAGGDSAGDDRADYDRILAEQRVLPPLDHPEPARCYVTGTGLSHLGSAQSRDAMHAKLESEEAHMTDSMKMFKWGVEGGKPAPGTTGVQPEWFYKGDGRNVVPPGRPLEIPGFALDGGEEPEIVGLYLIGDDGAPMRVGFALGNEFCDHVLEKQNYLYLAHSKLRNCSFGPELLTGELPRDIQGTVRIVRGGERVWQGAFASGEANMSHSIANLEHHHFKYGQFRRPGDVHCHFFGTATLSFAEGFIVAPGDVFEISAPPFGRPLRNPVIKREDEGLMTVKVL